MGFIGRRLGAHFIYACKINRRKTGFFLMYIFMSLVTLATSVMVETQLIPVAKTLAESNAKRVANIIINQSVNEILSRHGIEYGNLCSIEKNEAGEIIAVVPNIMKINELKTIIALDIQQRISDYKSSDIGIPIGSLTNSYILTGRGPRIPFKILASGNIFTNFSNTFTSAGINQTKHEISLEVSANISILLPAGHSSTVVEAKIPITETIIVGKVPLAFFDK